eukprot:2527461-Rhodomonas_salina.2
MAYAVLTAAVCYDQAEEGRYRGAEVSPTLHPEIQYKKPHFQYNLYQDCGFLYWISECTVRRARYAMPGTDSAESAMAYAVPGTESAYGDTAGPLPGSGETTFLVQQCGFLYLISQRMCYALRGTDAAYGATSIKAWLAHGAGTTGSISSYACCYPIFLCRCYAMSSTDLPYLLPGDGTEWLSQGLEGLLARFQYNLYEEGGFFYLVSHCTTFLRDVRYRYRVCCYALTTRCAVLRRVCGYAMCDSEIGYAPTRCLIARLGMPLRDV